MKPSIAYLIGIAMTMTPGLSATAMSAPPQSSTNASSAFTRVAADCPAGTHWESAGYAHGGKWRAAHCASNKAPNY